MSLPILVAMMLMSFRTYADIPDRMTVFYSQAFETLYSIHDSENKELYKREHHAGLAPDVFRSVLQAFCYLSLSNHDIEFSESSLNGYISRALTITRVQTTVEKYKNDLIHNVCIIQPDGLSYVFVHRSFQEYFAALFSLNYSGPKKFDVFEKIINVDGSNVLSMLLEMDHVKTKRYWVIPKLEFIKEVLEETILRPLHQKLKLFVDGIYMEGELKGKISYSFSVDKTLPINYITLDNISRSLGNTLGFSAIVGDLKPINYREILSLLDPIDSGENANPHGFAILHIQDDDLYFLNENSDNILKKMGFDRNYESFLSKISLRLIEITNEIATHTSIEDTELFS